MEKPRFGKTQMWNVTRGKNLRRKTPPVWESRRVWPPVTPLPLRRNVSVRINLGDFSGEHNSSEENPFWKIPYVECHPRQKPLLWKIGKLTSGPPQLLKLWRTHFGKRGKYFGLKISGQLERFIAPTNTGIIYISQWTLNNSYNK
jgi:hypothetical protein